MKRVLIIGSHPIRDDLQRQYEAQLWLTKEISCSEAKANVKAISEFDEYVLLSDFNAIEKVAADTEMIGLLDALAKQRKEAGQTNRVLCHMLLQTSIRQKLIKHNFTEEVRQMFEVNTFSMNDLWARKIQFDYESIDVDTNRRVRVVVFGRSDMAEAVMTAAAQACHFPNYVRNSELRTRITWVVDNIEVESARFISLNNELFEQSYYRVIDPSLQNPILQAHYPQYHGQRKDFVDVEWEFVKGDSYSPTVIAQLKTWTQNRDELLTIVFADSQNNVNLEGAHSLPHMVYEKKIPVWVYAPNPTFFKGLVFSPKYSSLHPFGNVASGYDITIPEVKMGKVVNFIYYLCHEENDSEAHPFTNLSSVIYATGIDHKRAEQLWKELANDKRESNLSNARSIPVKLRSLGITDGEIELSQAEIELMAQVEHNRWSVEQLLLDYRPCTDEELRSVARDGKEKVRLKKEFKVHTDLCAFSELQPDDKGKPAELYDLYLCAALPIILKEIETPNTDAIAL